MFLVSGTVSFGDCDLRRRVSVHRAGLSGIASLYGEPERRIRHAAGRKSYSLSDGDVRADGSGSVAGIQRKIRHVGISFVA